MWATTYHQIDSTAQKISIYEWNSLAFYPSSALSCHESRRVNQTVSFMPRTQGCYIKISFCTPASCQRQLYYTATYVMVASVLYAPSLYTHILTLYLALFWSNLARLRGRVVHLQNGPIYFTVCCCFLWERKFISFSCVTEQRISQPKFFTSAHSCLDSLDHDT